MWSHLSCLVLLSCLVFSLGIVSVFSIKVIQLGLFEFSVVNFSYKAYETFCAKLLMDLIVVLSKDSALFKCDCRA